MKITWYGHAAFAVEGLDATGAPRKVILDPYNYPLCGGYLPIDETADVVSVSHENPRYHSDLGAIRGEPLVVRGLEVPAEGRDVAGIRFEARTVYENDAGEGPNAMVKFALDGVTIAHQGDLGHALDGEALDFLRGVDVLLALAGGPPTIDLTDLRRAVDATRPALVFPMHYKTPKVNLNLLGIESFLDRFGDLPRLEPRRSSHTVNRDELPAETTVVILEHAR